MRNPSALTCLFVLIMAIPSPAVAQDRLTSDEMHLVSFVEDRIEESVDLLERVVNINSGSMNFEGVREVGGVFAEELEALGFETEWIDGSPFNRAGHLFARRGTVGPHFVLIGHLDTVFEPDSPFQEFVRIDDTTASGPGVIDMKGGDIVMLEALRALREAGSLDRMTVTVALIGDEESSGDPLEVGRQALVDAAGAADVALAFEPGDGDPTTAVIARRGFTGWELRTTGRRAHSSAIFSDDVGYGAINEAARILVGFYEAMADEELVTFNPGIMLGGSTITYDDQTERGTAEGKTNVISPGAVVAGDLRTISPESNASVKERMRAVVEDHLPGTSATIEFRDSYPPMAPTEGNRRLLAMLDEASRDLGYGPVAAVDPANAGAADVSFAANHVDMALDGLGLLGDGTHSAEETADLTTFPMQIKRTALLMHRVALGWE
ncbi:MAG: M20/M25/M40 family metallo-hydrolase [Rhodothermales bacterium]|nr:M20/M25/M40 family metallo-hydrolase [Rhodothermales bacterium]